MDFLVASPIALAPYELCPIPGWPYSSHALMALMDYGLIWLGKGYVIRSIEIFHKLDRIKLPITFRCLSQS